MLESKINSNQVIIGIIGLGYVGLNLAVSFCMKGIRVVGFDNDLGRVEMVNHCNSYITGISDDQLKNVAGGGLLKATLDMSRLKEVDVIIICVPTPLNNTKEPDLTALREVTGIISNWMLPGCLIILESSTYPGTTREMTKQLAGLEYYLAYSPERIDPGNAKYGMHNTPKLVSGIDKKSCDMALLLYSKIVDQPVRVKNMETAEMAKIFENVFRNVNIALVNELATLCNRMGISVWDVIKATATKPYGFMSFYPSLGVGGHCIPVDPYYLMNKAREYDFHTRFISLAAEINEKMPEYVFYEIWKYLNINGILIKNSKILVLGVTFKKDVNDIRSSPSIKLINMLKRTGADVYYNDPYVGAFEAEDGVMQAEKNPDMSQYDLVVMAVPHNSYHLRNIVMSSKLIYDTCNAFEGIEGDNIVRIGE